MQPPDSWGKMIGFMLGTTWFTLISWGIFGIVDLDGLLGMCCGLVILTPFAVVATVILLRKERERKEAEGGVVFGLVDDFGEEDEYIIDDAFVFDFGNE